MKNECQNAKYEKCLLLLISMVDTARNGLAAVLPSSTVSYAGRLLSLVKSLPIGENSESEGVFWGVNVPISKNAEIDAVISANNARIALKTRSKRSETANSALDEVSAPHDENDDDMDVDSDPVHYLSISQLIPANLQHQMATIAIGPFPNVKLSAIERILVSLVEKCPFGGPHETFKWSIIHDENLENRLLFVRFASVAIVTWFVKTCLSILTTVAPDCVVKMDRQAQGLLSDETELLTEEASQKAILDIKKILLNRKNYERTSARTGTEDLDEVMNYYTTYKVDNSELVEVPKDMKEQIVKDIVRFRSKVLSIEKDRRKKEMEQERKKAKNRLKLIFEGVKETAPGAPIAVEKDEDPKEPEKSELDEMSEREYSEYLAVSEKEELNRKYEEKLRHLQVLEINEKLKLQAKLESLQCYEERLLENKLVSVEGLKGFLGLDYDKMLTSSSSDTTSAKLRLFYANHSEYIRNRYKERSAEEAADREDAALEAESGEKSQKYALPVAPKNAPTTVGDSVGAHVEAHVEVASLSPEQLLLVKSKISGLIEEYLGIKEEVLIEYIYDFVVEKGLSQKEELVHELSETLDEDAVIVADELWAYIGKMGD